MAQRDYNQYCAAARALDVLGERWTLLLIRDLLVGPKRYTDLLRGLPGIGTNLLAERLKQLAAKDIVVRGELPPPAASKVYRLTERGAALEPLIVALAAWGLPLLGNRRPEQMWEPEWTFLALRAAFRPEVAAGLTEAYQFEVDSEVFHAGVTDGALETGRGPADDPACVLRADQKTFLGVADGSLTWEQASATGRYEISGDAAAFARCAEIFSLPDC